MASLIDWFGKRIEGALAQVNPWDNGADYNSVVHGQQNNNNQQQPQPQQQPQYQPPSQPEAFQQEAPKSSFESGLDAFQQTGNPNINFNNELTKKRQEEAKLQQQPKQNEPNLLDTIAKGAQDIAKETFSTGEKVFNTADLAGRALLGAGVLATDKLTGNDDAYRRNAEAVKATMDEAFNRKTNTGAQGTFISREQAENKNGNMVENFVKPVLATAGEVAPNVLPFGKIASAAAPLAGIIEKAVAPNLIRPAAKITGKIGQYAAEGAGVGTALAASDVARQYGETGKVDPSRALEMGLGGALLTGVTHGAIDGASVGARSLRGANDNVIHRDLTRSNPTYKRLNDENISLSDAVRKAKQSGAPDNEIAPQIQRLEGNMQSMRSIRQRAGETGSLRIPGPREQAPRTMSPAALESAGKRLRKFVNEEQAAKIMADAPEALKFENISNQLKRVTLPSGQEITNIGVKGGSRPSQIPVSTSASRTQQLRIRGAKAKSQEYNIPVSTPTTRRVAIDVRQPRSKSQEFVAVQTVDRAGNPFTELKPLDGTRHQLKNGIVVDPEGKPVGSYFALTPDGQQIGYVEGRPMNVTNITGDPSAWGNTNKAFTDFDRLIEANAPSPNVARKVQDFTSGFKDQQEAAMKAELYSRRKELAKREHDMKANLPKRGMQKDLTEDMFRLMEKKVDPEELNKKYGTDYVNNYMIPNARWARDKVFDEILDDTNKVLTRNGYDPIPRRDNYITHIQETPNFFENVGIGIQDLTQLGKSVSAEQNPGRGRGGIPDEIVGLTEQTGARLRHNPFAQSRKGSQTKQDFFDALDTYLEPMLFNKYMTPAASRVRIIERAFRLNEKAHQLQFEKMVDDLGFEEAKKQIASIPRHSEYDPASTARFVSALQEYGNALAGKSNPIDRVIKEKGKGGESFIKASTAAQGIVGASSIPGSATAALAQVLSLPQTIAANSTGSVLGAAKDMALRGVKLKPGDPLLKSPFMRSRYTDAGSNRITPVRKYTKAASIPLETIERFNGELSWRAAYREAKTRNPRISEQDAIRAADLQAKRTLAGRGVGDRPVGMSSRAAGLVTQFGLEVNNMRLQFFKDFNTAQKAKFIVAAAAMNAAYQSITGNKQLPDYLSAAVDTFGDIVDSDEEENGWEKTGQAAQRLLGETSKFVPGAGTVVNTFLDDKTKESIFGQNSDVTRFGTPAASKVGTSLWDAASEAIEGKFGEAARSLAKLAPTGTQVVRSAEGAGALDKGYTTDAKGNVQTQIDTSDPVNVAKTLLFGKYASNELKTFYDNNARALSDKQTEVFKNLVGDRPEKAKQYLEGIFQKRDLNKGTSDGTSAATLTDDSTPEEAKAVLDANIKDGTWKMQKGLVVNDKGVVQRGYYKDLAKALSNTKSKDAYAAYVHGYDLEPKAKDATKKVNSGNKLLDGLASSEIGAQRARSRASLAVSLYENAKSFEGVPDWVKEQYYKKHGFSKNDVQYAALSRVSRDAKLDKYYRPFAKNHTREQLVDEIKKGRFKSIYRDYVMAQDSIITDLYKEGFLTYADSRALKATKYDKGGKLDEKTATNRYSSRSRGGRKGKGSKGGKKAGPNIVELTRLRNKSRVPTTDASPGITTKSAVAAPTLKRTALRRYSPKKKPTKGRA